MADSASRAGELAHRFLGNRYAQENISDAIESLREAYARVSKRRVEPTRDEKLRRQLSSAVTSMTEAARALQSGRKKPERRPGRRLLVLVGVGALAAGAALAASEELRNAIFGRSPDETPSPGPVPEAPATEPAKA